MERITSRQNPTVKKLRALAKDRAFRNECGEFVCDGEKLLFEAIGEGFEITSALVSEEFSEKLLTEYGISGGAAEDVNLRGRVAVLMPGGENFSPQGADTIINLR